MIRIVLLLTALITFATCFACSKEPAGGGGTTPTDAYKSLFAAVKAKDTEAIKRNLTKKTIDLGATQSGRAGTPIEKVFENGFTETTFASSLPTIRDERINGTMGAIEVWNTKNSSWEELPFINEDGGWKLAIGDIFSGGYKRPGRGRDEIEKEAANLMLSTNGNTNSPAASKAPSR